MAARQGGLPNRLKRTDARFSTLRARLVLAATVAVVLAVLLACLAAYLVARNSLVGSIDGTLQSTATNVLSRAQPLSQTNNANGLDYQVVTQNGSVLVNGNLPVDSSVRAVATGNASQYFSTISVNGASYRQLVVHGYVTIGPTTFPQSQVPVAIQLVLPLASVNSQLGRLGIILVCIAVIGILVAIVLGWLVARTALVPLDDLTMSVEEIAETTDVSQRLDPGSQDELGRLRRAFNGLLAALERSREAQRQLVLDTTHELRTPLTSLRTNLEVARRIGELPPHERDVLIEDVITQMDELSNLVGDLAELSRGDQRQRAEPETFRLDQLIDDLVAIASTHGRPRQVSFDLWAQPTWSVGHPDRIQRAIGNLLDNALKWSPDGGTVEVTCEAGTVTVRDHGPGIAPEDLPHIFDRFYRAPEARGLPGSGLGLAIVAQVAHEEGGSVVAATAPGGGAVFRLDLPAVPEPADSAVLD